MKTVIFTHILFLASVCVLSQEHNKIIGVMNKDTTDKSFNEGQEAIKASILDGIANLNLYEYSYSLNELYLLLNTKKITCKEWYNYIDTLLIEVQREKKDTLHPLYATEYKGIIPLQAEFFVSTLEINTRLRDKYSAEYEILYNSTSKLLGKGYSFEEIDSLIVFFPKNSIMGTVNFWLFLQIYGCPIIESGKEKIGVEKMEILLRNLRMTSTYKTPLSLQLRKYRDLKQRIKPCLDKYNFELKGETAVRDKEKDTYFEMYLKEGIDKNKTKDF